MRTIRRIYLYLVSVISLQVVLWGVINLLRAMLDTQRVGGSTTALASALATIIVGLPVFFLHWWLIQRRIPVDTEERSAGVRAIFLYGLLMGLLIPVAQNLLAILNRAFFNLFNLRAEMSMLGANQTWIDNGVAMLMNALLAVYFMDVIRKDWKAGFTPKEDRPAPSLENLTLAQRVFRYALVVYSLGLLVYGIQQILRYILDQFGPPNINALSPLANGLSLTIFGVLLWWNSWRTVQQSVEKESEQKSMFRLVFLYLLVLVGLITVLVSVGDVMYEALRLLLGRATPFEAWLQQISGVLSAAVPFSILWAYHLQVLKQDQAVVPATPRREGLSRLYGYLLAFIGLMVSFVALQSVGAYIVDEVTSGNAAIGTYARNTLAGGLAALIVGMPLWLRTWLQVNGEAHSEGDAGDRARRSLSRKVFLYLSIFVGVVGVMISAGGLIFQLLGLALGDRNAGSPGEISDLVKTLLLFIVLLVYHWRVLQNDGRLEAVSLTEKHSLFAVLVLDPGDETFAGPIVAALRDEAPGIPVAVHFTSSGVPGEMLTGAGAVVLSAGMAANPPEAMRIWLQAFTGTRIVVPVAKTGWIWIDADTTSPAKLNKQVAQALRKLAEGEAMDGSGRISAWVIVASVFGGLFGLTLLINLIAYLLSF